MPIVGSFAGASSRAYGLQAGGALGDYESISTVTVGAGGAANIEFTSIPASYKHLQIRGVLRTTTANTGNDNALLQFNSDTASNYSWHKIQGGGASASSANGTSQTSIRCAEIPRNNVTASIFAATIIDIIEYANTNKHKSIRTLDGYGNSVVNMHLGTWRSTSAITSIKIIPEINNFAQYSTLALYGIKG